MGYTWEMAWKETRVNEERTKLLGEYLSGEYGVSELARAYGVSRKTVYKWVRRFEAEGVKGLADRSRAPHRHGKALRPEVELAILRWKRLRSLWGAPKIRVKLLAELGEKCPAESTISAVLKRHGLSRVPRKRRHGVPSEAPLSHCEAVNVVWCADFKGWFRTADGSKCVPLTITDGHSRYLIRCQSLGDQTGSLVVQPVFIAAFREHGLPAAMRTDNGSPFASSGLGGLTELSVWWVRLGIRLERIEPGQPQQNGRHERMHRTLKEATAQPPSQNLRAQQRAFDEFRQEYNEERPHEALGQRPPAAVYRPSTRAYPERLPPQKGYPEAWEKRKVRKRGQIKWQGKDVRITPALRGQEVGLKPLEKGRWEVYFEHLKLGIFEERTGKVKAYKRLQATVEEADKP